MKTITLSKDQEKLIESAALFCHKTPEAIINFCIQYGNDYLTEAMKYKEGCFMVADPIREYYRERLKINTSKIETI